MEHIPDIGRAQQGYGDFKKNLLARIGKYFVVLCSARNLLDSNPVTQTIFTNVLSHELLLMRYVFEREGFSEDDLSQSVAVALDSFELPSRIRGYVLSNLQRFFEIGGSNGAKNPSTDQE